MFPRPLRHTLTTLGLLALSLLPGCGGSGSVSAAGGPSPYASADVYLAGYQIENLVPVAKFWKNGQAASLGDGATSSLASKVLVAGGNVYVAGQWGRRAALWTNGVATLLTDGSQPAFAQALAIDGTDVYVGGYESNGTYRVAKVWKNGVERWALSDGTRSAEVKSLCVAGGHVYAGGYATNTRATDVAMVWQDGAVMAALDSGGKDAEVADLAMAGADLYAVGFAGILPKQATVWKNGTAQALTDGTRDAEATTSAVSGTDLYVGGYESNGTRQVAKVWKNGTLLQTLSDGSNTGEVSGLAVAGTDVYAGGTTDFGGGLATLWKNGVPNSLGNGDKAWVFGLSVQPR
jgi:hypothetical protein